MANKKKKLVKYQCQVCKQVDYFTYKNPAKITRKLEFKKYCPTCRKHTLHKESKKG